MAKFKAQKNYFVGNLYNSKKFFRVHGLESQRT